MNVLLLSCNTGEGHNTAARAVCEELVAEGHSARLLDMMSLKSRHTSRVVGNAYIRTAKYAPRLFGAVYRLGGVISAPDRHSPVYYANCLLTKYLSSYLSTHACDAIVTSHLYGAEVLTHMKRAGLLRQPTLAVGTDYTCIPFWEETRCDAYVVGHEDVIGDFAAKGIPRELLYPLGIPVSAPYQTPRCQPAAQAALGLAGGQPLVLVMGGSMAFGKMGQFALQAAQALPTARLAVLCGSDRRLFDCVQTAARSCARILPVGYTDKVALYMDAADLVFTKPGGLTSTEALCKNLPIVHTSPIPGCETCNADFFASHGLSLTAPTAAGQIELGRRLLEGPALRRRMSLAQSRAAKPNAARDICELLRRLQERA